MFGPDALVVILTLGSGFAVEALLMAGLILWGRWVARRQGGGWWWTLAWLPVLGVAAAALGVLGTIIGMMNAFSAVAEAEPSMKATLLAEGIEAAMISTAIGVGVSTVLHLANCAVLIAGTVRAPRIAVEVTAADAAHG